MFSINSRSAPSSSSSSVARPKEASALTGLGRQLSVAALSLGLSLGLGCERKSSDGAALSSRQTQTHSDGAPAGLKAKTQTRELSYEIPLVCPAGAELVTEKSAPTFSAQERLVLNSAYYLWKQALQESATSRAEIMGKLTLIADPARLPADSPLTAPIRAAIDPLQLKAAFILASLELENLNTKEKHWEGVPLMTFLHLSEHDSFFGTVAGFGHELLHAEQAKGDQPGPDPTPRAELFRRELEAYGQEAADLMKVAEFLRHSPTMPAERRAANLDAWLTDIAGQVLGAGFYSFRFKAQYYSAVIDDGLKNITVYLNSKGESQSAEKLSGLRASISPLLAYEKDIQVDSERVKLAVGEMAAVIKGSAALNDPANPKLLSKTEGFLKTLGALPQALDELKAAEERLANYRSDPKPLD